MEKTATNFQFRFRLKNFPSRSLFYFGPVSATVLQAEDKEAKKDKKDSGQRDKLERSVLRFPPEIAPVKCAILSLDMRVARDTRYEEQASLQVRGPSGEGWVLGWTPV